MLENGGATSVPEYGCSVTAKDRHIGPPKGATEMNAPATRFEELDRGTCLELLGGKSVGRLAVTRPGRPPHLVPVNYTLLRGSVVFRTPPGTKLTLLVTEPVSFEVDEWDPVDGTGWSVVVEGLAYEASDREMEVEEIHLDSAAEAQNARWVRLMPETITGRRVGRPDGGSGPAVLVPDPGLASWHGTGSARFPS